MTPRPERARWIAHGSPRSIVRQALALFVLLAGTACNVSPSSAQAAHDGSSDAAEFRSPAIPVATPAAPRVEWHPASPVQGAIVVLTIHAGDSLPASAIAGVDGAAAGQALFFERGENGAWSAVGGIPIDTRDSLTIPLFVHFANTAAESVYVSFPVAVGDYRMERLTVAPRFGQQPDSALARRIANEGARARAVSRDAFATPRLWSPPFFRPRPGRITSGFGHGRTFNGQVQSRHMGTDFAGAVGTPVRAANCGVVRLVADFHLAGRAIYLDHGAGLVTGYFHLSEPLVSEGDTVRTGELIGRSGATGRVTGPHLHWIARYGSTTVDPMSLFTLDSASASGITQPAQPCVAAPAG